MLVLQVSLNTLTHLFTLILLIHFADCADYSNSDSCCKSTTVIVGVVCSLVFLSVGVLLGVVGLHLIQRGRGKLSKPSSPSPPPVSQEVTYEVVDVPSSKKTQPNAKDAYALSENIPTSHNTAYGQVQL